jgi:hypothetical protein
MNDGGEHIKDLGPDAIENPPFGANLPLLVSAARVSTLDL